MKEAPLISHEASFVHPVDEEKKKAQGSTKIVEALLHSSEPNPSMEVIKPSLSPSSHHKPYKKDTRKWRTKKKKYDDHHFEAGPRDVLGSSFLKLFPGKLKSRWSGSFKETNMSPCGESEVVNESPTRRIKVNTQRLKEYLGGKLD